MLPWITQLISTTTHKGNRGEDKHPMMWTESVMDSIQTSVFFLSFTALFPVTCIQTGTNVRKKKNFKWKHSEHRKISQNQGRTHQCHVIQRMETKHQVYLLALCQMRPIFSFWMPKLMRNGTYTGLTLAKKWHSKRLSHQSGQKQPLWANNSLFVPSCSPRSKKLTAKNPNHQNLKRMKE